MAGAVDAAAQGNHEEAQRALEALKEQIQRETGDYIDGSTLAYVSEFNSDSARPEDVIGLMERAARECG